MIDRLCSMLCQFEFTKKINPDIMKLINVLLDAFLPKYLEVVLPGIMSPISMIGENSICVGCFLKRPLHLLL